MEVLTEIHCSDYVYRNFSCLYNVAAVSDSYTVQNKYKAAEAKVAAVTSKMLSSKHALKGSGPLSSSFT
jgi:hypothetical protein